MTEGLDKYKPLVLKRLLFFLEIFVVNIFQKLNE